jgi:valyl-tRNA synthetase
MGHALDETLQDIADPLASRMQGYSPCGCRAPTTRRLRPRSKIVEASCARRASRRRKSAVRSSSSAPGPGRTSTAAASSSSSRSSAPPATGTGSASRWTRAATRPSRGVEAVREGLIYRGERIINWCPTARPRSPTRRLSLRSRKARSGICATRSSDGTDYIELATTRPETMLGDTASPSTRTTSATRILSARR